MNHIKLTALPLLLLLFATVAQAAVPQLINYQGYVTDISGVPLGDVAPVNRKVTFRFWNSANATADANRLYSEYQTVTINGGDFSVLIGQGTPTGESNVYADLADAFSGATVFLEITVDDGDTIDNDQAISPRQQIVTTAFAFRAQVAESVDSLAITSNMISSSAVKTAQIDNSAVTSSKIADYTIVGNDIANYTIGVNNMAANSINTSAIQADAVNSSKIQNESITSSDLAANSVGASEIATGAVNSSEIADYSIQSYDITTSIGLWSNNGGTKYTYDKVGIGTSNPTRGKMEIDTWAGSNNIAAGFGLLNANVVSANGAGTYTGESSLYVSNRVIAFEFIAPSDARIKNIAGLSDSLSDLQTLMQIEVTDYTYIDSVTKGEGTYKKVIAQQVDRVYPQAVTKTTDYVPDIYQRANVTNGWIQLATNLQAGERVHLITEGGSGVYEVLEVKPGQFRTGLVTDKKVVFVYGREVDDFLNVDYEALAMLNVSATQQIKKEMEAEIATLREVNQHLLTRLEKLEAMMRDGAANSTPATQSASSGN